MDNNRTVSIMDHCQTIKDDYQSKSTSTLRPTLSLRKNLENCQTNLDNYGNNRLELMIKQQQQQKRRQEKRAKKRPKKLHQININLEIPLRISHDTTRQKPTKFTPQRLRLNEDQDDDLEIIYRSIQSIGDLEAFQPRYESSRVYTNTPLVLPTKTTSIQTSIDRDRDGDQDFIKSQLLRRARRRNVFYRHGYTKCRQALLKNFYYGLKLSNYQELIDKNHNLCNAIIAYCLTKMKPPKLWHCDDLDLILSNGRRFYELAQKRPQLPQYCCIRDDCGKIRKRCYFYLANKPKICGYLSTKNRRIYNLTKGLQIFFGNTRKRRYCLLQINNFYNFLLWKTRYFYYYFDTTTLENYAILANIHNLKAAITVILKNKQIYNDNNIDNETKFKIYPIKIIQIINIDDYTDNDDDDGYRLINDKKATITASYDLNHPIFGIARNRQSLITVLIALIYSKMIQTNCWIRDTINQILIYGNHLYLQLMKEIETITIDTVPDRIVIGAFIIETTIKRDSMVDNPEQLGVKFAEFFHHNTSGIIEITTNKGEFTLGIWRQRDFFYLFDPYLCNNEGYRIGVKNGGGACCTIAPILSIIIDLIRTNFDSIATNYRIYSFNIKQAINQLKSTKTIEQQLLEMDKIVPKYPIVRQTSCVDLDDENFFGRFHIEQQHRDYISDNDLSVGGEGGDEAYHESYNMPMVVRKISKSTEIDADLLSVKLPMQKTELPEAKSLSIPKIWMIFSTKTIDDYYQQKQTNIDYLLPFVYLVAGVFAKCHNINNWTPEILDNCLKYGVELFQLFELRYDQLANFLIKTIKIEQIRYQIRVDYLIEIRMDFNNLKLVFRNYLNKFNCFILITPNYCCFIYTNQQQFYLFDSINNKYCLCCFNNNLDAMLMKIINNKNRCELFKQLPQYHNCVISSCIVDEIIDNVIIDNRQQLERINGNICLNYYICLCANLLLLTTINVLTDNNYRYINEIIKKGKLLYLNDNQRNINTKKLIKNLLINNYYFDLIVKLIVFKKSQDFDYNFQLITKKHQFLLLQYDRNFYSIFIDKLSDSLHLFDPIRIDTGDNDQLKWLKLDNFQQFVDYLQHNNTTNHQIDKGCYHFYQFEIISFVKKKGERSR